MKKRNTKCSTNRSTKQEYNPDQMDLFDDSNFRNTLDYSKEETEDIALSYYAKDSKQYRNSEGWDD